MKIVEKLPKVIMESKGSYTQQTLKHQFNSNQYGFNIFLRYHQQIKKTLPILVLGR